MICRVEVAKLTGAKARAVAEVSSNKVSSRSGSMKIWMEM